MKSNQRYDNNLINSNYILRKFKQYLWDRMIFLNCKKKMYFEENYNPI